MVISLILDVGLEIGYWLIKNVGIGSYNTIRYILGYDYQTEEEKEKQELLKNMIEQKHDIEEIKKLLEELKNPKLKKESDENSLNDNITSDENTVSDENIVNNENINEQERIIEG